MKIVLAPDSFKGSMTSPQACQAMAEGLRRVKPDAEIIAVPMADGGEGTLDALVSAAAGQMHQLRVVGPLGQQLQARFGILAPDPSRPEHPAATAVVEMAQAAGLTLIPPNQRNPLHTTTYGVGQIIQAAAQQGCRHFIVTLGGSATNDCGTGMAQALGVRFLDYQGKEITTPMTGDLMGKVASVDCRHLPASIRQSSFVAACDVDNPLLGPRGATYVYGPQKGANTDALPTLEANMNHIIGLIEKTVGKEVQHLPGAGAAGGLAAGLMAFLNARLEKGIDVVMRYCQFAEKIRHADLVITGEGQIDASTVCGKTIHGIAQAAAQQGVPIIALTGSIGPDARKVMDIGVNSVLPICSGPMTLKQAIRDGPKLLADASEQALRLATIQLKPEQSRRPV